MRIIKKKAGSSTPTSSRLHAPGKGRLVHKRQPVRTTQIKPQDDAPRGDRPLKVIVFTGGVLSGLGKGVAAASIGRLLVPHYKVVPLKCDGYLNVDPGTMNPVEHGEVFVLDDGTEVDMDFGHYERFLGVSCKGSWNLTMGKVFDAIRIKERSGDYLGKTVQFIPHVTDLIQRWWLAIAKAEDADVLLIEIGGTVGDMENELYIEAARQLKKRLGAGNILYAHLTYVPTPGGVHEQKSKPTQQSVEFLREAGIFPDMIIARAEEPLSEAVKEKIALFCDIEQEAIVSNIDTPNIYEIPMGFEAQGVRDVLAHRLSLPGSADLAEWASFAGTISELEAQAGDADSEVVVALCGKYTALEDSYASIAEALLHVGAHQRVRVKAVYVDTTTIRTLADAKVALDGVDAVIIPGGFGSRGVEGKILAICYCREGGIPFLGICLGLQLAVVEFARHVCGLAGANSTEMDADAKHPVIDIMPEQRGIEDKGATMRLGAYPALLAPGTLVRQVYAGARVVSERHRHRYEVNPSYHAVLVQKGMVLCGMSPNGRLVEFLELPKAAHPYFVATQAHPELKSSLVRPAPLFMGLVQAARERSKARKD